ncbi:peptidoglycan DD-metalloendopeptidase family protein [Pseudomonas sp. HR96]|uniref:peptidoglycan DD-metalloendopeptidase family protein n=1 Tax=Pseudomonas sp. HR96 TaxID=1027966 RepID=UPI002A765643|nr:peptidoglycan DD-metalloendopeptidase family protein [Pseudomonas sp. HR96]WPP01060.1 peptidoglycan DD-metalloendopeptidase family protein [Pseudomonas sp. HR96]
MSLTVNRQRVRRFARTGSSFKLLTTGLVLALTLVGCASAPSNGVRVVDRSNGGATGSAPARAAAATTPQRPMVTTGQYVVRRGDTLYSIAFRYGWDFKALAERNRIAPPYTLYLGRVIRFDGGSGTAPAAAPRTEIAAAPGSTSTVTSSSTPSSSLKTTVIRRPIVAAPAVATGTPVPSSTVAPSTNPVPAGERLAGNWAWPANGTLIGKFASNGSLNKGIDIAGDLGQPVFAASDGSVVYAGSGLRGYGELIIIKHGDTYVSAYGHNRRLLVREGQQVKVGQTIAEMGSTGTDRVKLHFEIRRQGKPVDPLQFLPRR